MARRGYGTEGDALVSHTVDKIDLNVVWDVIKSATAEWNKHQSALVSLLTFKTTTPGDAVPQASNLPAFEKATEFGVAQSIRQGGALPVGYTLEDYDLRLGTTWKFLRQATKAQVLDLANQALAADQALMTTTILNRLFDGTVDANENATPVYGLWNGSGTMVPPTYMGTSFAADHNHILVSGGTAIDSEDVEVMINHLNHHGYGLEANTRVLILCNRVEADVIASFRGGEVNNNSKTARFDFIPGVLAPPYLTEEHLVGERAPDKFGGIPLLGSYGRAFIAESPLIPAGYVAAVVTGGANAKSNVIGFREWADSSYQGLRLIPGIGPYPLQDSHYQRSFGVGVRQRGGAVIMQVKASGSYDIPDISA